jgi:hypothetical protein
MDQQSPTSLAGILRSRAANMVGFTIGASLLCAALFTVLRQRHVFSEAWTSIHNLAPSTVVVNISMLFGSVILNTVLSGILFSVLISRKGRVGWIEMQAVIAAATLLNYVPFRPGLFGRVAYHKTVNNIALRDSAMVVVQAMALSAIAVCYLGSSVLANMYLGMDFRLLLVAPLPLLALGGPFSTGGQRIALLAMLVRYLEALVNAMRYRAAFVLIGSPIDARGAVAFACVSMATSMVPLLSNGLGMREWAVGILAPVLTASRMTLGIAADLLNRAAELVIVTILGLAGFALLARKRKSRA